MILIGIGANLDHPTHGSPLSTCRAALRALGKHGCRVVRCSRWYRSAPLPISDQPWFVNAVVEVETQLTAPDLLDLLHRIEEDFGRSRKARNEARVLDLDLLAYHQQISSPGKSPQIPHPRLIERAFVVLPISVLASVWRHPVSLLTIKQLESALPEGQVIEVID